MSQNAMFHVKRMVRKADWQSFMTYCRTRSRPAGQTLVLQLTIEDCQSFVQRKSPGPHMLCFT
jgi:hypothetical protein